MYITDFNKQHFLYIQKIIANIAAFSYYFILKASILNNKEFTSELSRRLGYTTKDTTELISLLIQEMTKQLEDGNIIQIQGFGSFEVKKKTERISVNPTTKQRMLVPPKLVLTYKPNIALKEKFK